VTSQPLSALTDAQLLDELDELVVAAVGGCRRAIAALAIGYGPVLLKEAREDLGTARAHEAGDALAELFVEMLRCTLEFVPGRDCARQWLGGQVRRFARPAIPFSRPRRTPRSRCSSRWSASARTRGNRGPAGA
jgi:hypothetical protein